MCGENSTVALRPLLLLPTFYFFSAAAARRFCIYENLWFVAGTAFEFSCGAPGIEGGGIQREENIIPKTDDFTCQNKTCVEGCIAGFLVQGILTVR